LFGNNAVVKYEIVVRYTGNLGEREMLKSYIPSGEVGGPTIYAVKQEHIYRVERKSEIEIWKTRENK